MYVQNFDLAVKYIDKVHTRVLTMHPGHTTVFTYHIGWHGMTKYQPKKEKNNV